MNELVEDELTVENEVSGETTDLSNTNNNTIEMDEENLGIDKEEELGYAEKETENIEKKKEDKITESEDYRTLKTSIQQIRELVEKYEENAREAEEASSYCTAEDLSFAGVGMEDKIIDCSTNYREMAQKLYDYADSLEASLNEIK